MVDGDGLAYKYINGKWARQWALSEKSISAIAVSQDGNLVVATDSGSVVFSSLQDKESVLRVSCGRFETICQRADSQILSCSNGNFTEVDKDGVKEIENARLNESEIDLVRCSSSDIYAYSSSDSFLKWNGKDWIDFHDFVVVSDNEPTVEAYEFKQTPSRFQPPSFSTRRVKHD